MSAMAAAVIVCAVRTRLATASALLSPRKSVRE